MLQRATVVQLGGVEMFVFLLIAYNKVCMIFKSLQETIMKLEIILWSSFMTECEVCVSLIPQHTFHIIFQFEMNVVKWSCPH